MSERVTMPALGESVTEGTVTRWLKNVGDTVAVDEPLLEVSTDKVDTEIPSPVAGVLQEILAQEDDTVPVGADLAVIGDGSEGSGGGEQPAQQDGGQDEQAQEQPAEDQAQEQPAEEAPAAEAPSTEQEPQAATSEPEQHEASGQDDSPAPETGSGSDSGSSGGETVKMPALGESVTEGTVTRWLKAEGDSVEVDEPLLEVSTDKVDTEIPSPVAGTLTKILVQEDDTVPVGGDLAIIGGSGGGSAPAQEAPAQESPAQEAPAQEAPTQQETSAQEAPAQEAPQKEAPAQEAPKQEAPAAPHRTGSRSCSRSCGGSRAGSLGL